MKSRHWSEARMSPSKLGAFCNPERCDRCLWTLLRLKFKKPYSFPMPALMNSLDLQEKQLAEVLLKKDKTLPEYFGAFRDAVEILPIVTVSGFHDETGIELYGKPDLVTQDAAGLVSVIDNKTAQPKPPEHALTKMYTAQINFYGYLMEQMEEPYQVSRVGLLYYAVSPLTDAEVYENTGSDKMWALFRPHMVEIEYDPENIVVPLLREVRSLIDATSAPEGKEGCKDCELLKGYEDCLHVTDQAGYRMMDSWEKRREDHAQHYRQFTIPDDARQLQLDSLSAIAELERPYGALAQWR